VVTRWFFRLRGYARGGKERRMPASWLCLACQLQQGEVKLILFTFMPPARAQALLSDFHEIKPAEVYTRSVKDRLVAPSRPTVPAATLAGKEGRYWLAERNRWQEGAELTAADFETFIQAIKKPAGEVSE
jgi:hypothetical protein